MNTHDIEQNRAAFEEWWNGPCNGVPTSLSSREVLEGRALGEGWALHIWSAAIEAALQSQDREPCTWEHDAEIDAYDTACGNAFIVGEGTPAENDMKFCCYCGRVLKEAIDHARRIEGKS